MHAFLLSYNSMAKDIFFVDPKLNINGLTMSLIPIQDSYNIIKDLCAKLALCSHIAPRPTFAVKPVAGRLLRFARTALCPSYPVPALSSTPRSALRVSKPTAAMTANCVSSGSTSTANACSSPRPAWGYPRLIPRPWKSCSANLSSWRQKSGFPGTERARHCTYGRLILEPSCASRES